MAGSVALLLSALCLQVVVPKLSPPASASSSLLCVGFSSCGSQGMKNAGYHEHWGHMYWRMYSGRNCVNYAAYRMVQAGMPDVRPWSGSGNATNWGRAMSSITDHTPVVGSIAWWRGGAQGASSLGHVAYVERVVSSSEIIVSESNWGSDFDWRRITKDSYWPTGFIHFRDRAFKNIVRPKIVGTPKVGVHLTVGGGKWQPAGKPSYQWLQDGKPIPGQTGQHFMPIRTQIGHRLSVRVTASRPNYQSTSVVTAQTAPVVPGDLTMTAEPSISGTPEVGHELTVDPGTYSPSGYRTSVQWYADGQPLQGQTGATYTPTQDDAGKTITVKVHVTRMGHNPRDVTTDAVGPVIGTPVKVVKKGDVTGALRPGRVLHVDPGRLSPASAKPVSYQWRRNGVPIPGATHATYRTTTADVGRKITVMARLAASHHKSISEKYTGGSVRVFPRMTVKADGGTNRIAVTVRVWAPGVGFDGTLVRVMSDKRVHWVRVVDGVARTTYRHMDAGKRRVRVTFDNAMVVPRTIQVPTHVSARHAKN